MSESIHVPASYVRRLKALGKLLFPVVLVAAGTAWTTTVTWFRTRTSAEEIRPEIVKQIDEIRPALTEATENAATAKARTDTQRVQIYALQNTALALAHIAIELHAQAEVLRAYGKSPRLPEYIERARRFYTTEFDRALDAHPGEVVLALKAAQRAVWRPDRD